MKPLVIASAACLPAVCGFALSGQKNKSSCQGEPTMFKAVIHINFSDSERQKHGLKNVANMLQEVQGDFEIEVVCHGSGIGLLVRTSPITPLKSNA